MSLAPRHAIGLLALLVALPGCFATTKHVRQIEQDMTREHAWTDEQVQSLQADLTAVRSENNALRTRMADLESQLTSLGGEVSDRIHELSQSDQEIGMQIAETSQRADALGAEQSTGQAEMMERLNLVVEEVLAENKKLRDRISALESSAFTFGREHTVKSGETVASIAAEYGVSAADIIAANGLPDANRISVGQSLLIPGVGQ